LGQRDSGRLAVTGSVNRAIGMSHHKDWSARQTDDSGVYVCQHLSFTAFGKACGGKAKVRTESGKPRRSGSQGGLRKRGLWKRLNGHVKRKRRNRPSLCLRLRAPYFYPDQRLSLPTPREGSRKTSQGFKPDSGNLTVRDYRRVSGNVRHGGNVNPPAIERAAAVAWRVRFLSQ
jgi:hypothetical protein